MTLHLLIWLAHHLHHGWRHPDPRPRHTSGWMPDLRKHSSWTL